MYMYMYMYMYIYIYAYLHTTWGIAERHELAWAQDASPQEVAECSFVPSEVHALEDTHSRLQGPASGL